MFSVYSKKKEIRLTLPILLEGTGCVCVCEYACQGWRSSACWRLCFSGFPQPASEPLSTAGPPAGTGSPSSPESSVWTGTGRPRGTCQSWCSRSLGSGPLWRRSTPLDTAYNRGEACETQTRLSERKWNTFTDRTVSGRLSGWITEKHTNAVDNR